MTDDTDAAATDRASEVFSALDETADWQGLGIQVPESICRDPKKIVKHAGLNWRAEKRECFYRTSAGELKQATNREVIVRTDTEEMLSIVSTQRYKVLNRQPVDMVESFRDQLAKEKMVISNVAALRGGADVVCCAMLPKDFDFRVGPKHKKKDSDDVIRSYVTLMTGFAGHGTKCLKGTIRIWCYNTLIAATKQAREMGTLKTIRASTIIETDTLPKLIEMVASLIEQEKKQFNALANAQMSDEDVKRYFADLLEVDIADIGKTAKGKDGKEKKLISTKTENILTLLTDSYTNAPGADPIKGTAWGALNAVTHYATHRKVVRDTSGGGEQAARVASNLNGDAARLKLRALELAESYVGRMQVAA